MRAGLSLIGSCGLGPGRTSGLGPRTGKALSMGYVECEPGQSLAELCEPSYQILVAGTHYEAQPLRHAPYDPTGRLMRGS